MRFKVGRSIDMYPKLIFLKWDKEIHSFVRGRGYIHLYKNQFRFWVKRKIE